MIKERNSKYWDDFEKRMDETVVAIKQNKKPKVRRVACFITEKCNFNCKYCNSSKIGKTMSKENFLKMLDRYGNDAIIHITGGEPSVVPWLYPLLSDNSHKYRFHLNTNAYILPPAASVKRLKISLDSVDSDYWNKLVGKNAFDRVVKNIQYSIPKTIVSLTYTLNKQNYKGAIKFAEFCNVKFPGLYAIFFSVYKGTNKEFILSKSDINHFFDHTMPGLLKVLNNESACLLKETIDEKVRLLQGIRFEQNCNLGNKCYLSMSERVIAPNGEEYTCSHLYRDGIFMTQPNKHIKCRYGCNQRLVKFNKDTELLLKG